MTTHTYDARHIKSKNILKCPICSDLNKDSTIFQINPSDSRLLSYPCQTNVSNCLDIGIQHQLLDIVISIECDYGHKSDVCITKACWCGEVL